MISLRRIISCCDSTLRSEAPSWFLLSSFNKLKKKKKPVSREQDTATCNYTKTKVVNVIKIMAITQVYDTWYLEAPWVKIPLGTQTSHIRVPGFKSQLCFCFQALDNVHLEDRRCWFKYLCQCHPRRKSHIKFRLLASDQSSHICCGFLENNTVNGKSLFFTFFFILQINKKTSKNQET